MTEPRAGLEAIELAMSAAFAPADHAAPRVVLAVSGGVDSMVMLHAAARATEPARLVVATFDHGTGEFARDAVLLVESTAGQLGVEFVSARATEPLETEAEFRAARWAFLRETARERDALIATAHTRDDQIETVLMRVLRSAGARGIAGLFAQSDTVRPFLNVSRETIAEYARRHDVAWLEDPTNNSPRYFRNRVRHNLLPAFRAEHASFDDDLLNVARRAAVWRDDVDAFVTAHIKIRALPANRGLDIDLGLFSELSPRDASTLWPAILSAHGVVLDRRGTERVARFGASAHVGARMQLSGGWQVVRARDALQLRASDEVNLAGEATPTPLALSNSTTWGAGAAEAKVGDWWFRAIEATSPEVERVASDAWSAWLPTDRALSIRAWQAGDAMSAAAGRTSRKIKHLLSEAGVTGHERRGWPVVLAGDQVIWVPGVRRPLVDATRSAQSGLLFVCDYFDRRRDR